MYRMRYISRGRGGVASLEVAHGLHGLEVAEVVARVAEVARAAVAVAVVAAGSRQVPSPRRQGSRDVVGGALGTKVHLQGHLQKSTLHNWKKRKTGLSASVLCVPQVRRGALLRSNHT